MKKKRDYKLPASATPPLLMLKVAGSPRRVHCREPFNERFWVESRWCWRGWWSVLWPWPDGNWQRVRQFPGLTLPVYCRTREEAVEWAFTLAAQLEQPANMKRRIVWPKRVER
jgi:hypothetical protein